MPPPRSSFATEPPIARTFVASRALLRAETTRRAPSARALERTRLVADPVAFLATRSLASRIGPRSQDLINGLSLDCENPASDGPRLSHAAPLELYAPLRVLGMGRRGTSAVGARRAARGGSRVPRASAVVHGAILLLLELEVAAAEGRATRQALRVVAGCGALWTRDEGRAQAPGDPVEDDVVVVVVDDVAVDGDVGDSGPAAGEPGRGRLAGDGRIAVVRGVGAAEVARGRGSRIEPSYLRVVGTMVKLAISWFDSAP